MANRGRILDRLEDPVLLIDQRRNILYGNAAAGRVLRAKGGLEVRAGRLVVATSSGNARLMQTLTDCKQAAPAGNKIRGVKLPRKSARGHWLMMISALDPPDGDTDARIFIVHLVSRVPPRQLPVAALHDLFDLTHREVEVASGLLRYETLRDIAERMSCSHETIRSYVKRIFRKCEVRSQSGLIALLHRLSLLTSRC